MSAKIEFRKNTLTAYLDGEIDHHTASLIRMGIDDAILHKRPEELILDFGGVTFMDSSGIGLIIGRYKLLERRGGSVAVINADARVDRIFEMSGLYQIVERMA